MSEEEIIDVFKTVIMANKFCGVYTDIGIIIDAMKGLLDLYKKEKEKNEELSKKLYLCTPEIPQNSHTNYINYIDLINELNKLKERNEYLEENDYVWHQLRKMQDKREYRSKFLKEFQEEFGKNVLPDFDEIYNRYDKQKKLLENSISKDKITLKIEELENYIQEHSDDQGYWGCKNQEQIYETIDILKELLEE